MTCRLAYGLAAIAGLIAPTFAKATAGKPSLLARQAPQPQTVAVGSSCSALMGLGVPQTTITYTIRTYAGTFVLPGTTGPVARSVPPFDSLPEFCRVTATIAPSPDSSIGTELWMPTGLWNGKFLAVGNTSPGRSINYPSMAAAVARGYATASTSAGDRDDAVHAMTVSVKRIIEAYYGRGPWVSFLNGCGLGGRHGLEAASRYPDDFDGIVVGAPSRDGIRGVVDPASPDLSRFTSTGGKLLLYHGTSDQVVPPAGTIEYHRQVVSTLPAASRDSIRLFLIPDEGHCAAGESADTAELVSALATWVEKRQAPTQIVASRVSSGKVDLTRLLCAYPSTAIYKGTGSQDDAANFVCKAP